MSAGEHLYQIIRGHSPDTEWQLWESLTTVQQAHYEVLAEGLSAPAVSRGIWRVMRLLQYYDLDGLHEIEMGQEFLDFDGHMQVANHVCGPFWLLRIKRSSHRQTIYAGPGTPNNERRS